MELTREQDDALNAWIAANVTNPFDAVPTSWLDLPTRWQITPNHQERQVTVCLRSEISSDWFMEETFDMEEESNGFEVLTGIVLELQENIQTLDLLQQENKILQEQLAQARKDQFGTSSEQQPNAGHTDQEGPTKDQQSSTEPKQSKPRAVSNAGRKPLPEHLPRDTVIHSLTESERGCPCCGKTMREMGSEITEQLIVIPAQYRVNRHIQKKYSCRDCGRIVCAPKPKSIVPGSSYASPEFLAHVASNKYQLGLPFYRQEAMFKQSGLPFNRTTMANLMITCADQLTPLVMALQEELLKQKIVHADETTMQVLKEDGRKPQTKSYVWLYRSAAAAEKPVVIFDYQATRAGKHPKEFLEDFSGYLHVDGYAGYNGIAHVARVACMAHLRRKFVKAEDILPENCVELSFAQQATKVIGELYGIERRLTDQPKNIRYEIRKRESIPILIEFKKWLDGMKPKVTPKSALGKAIHYAIEQWPAMLRYVEDGDLAIDNNIAEREIKQIVIGRKNWLFADTPDGAIANATMYTLVQTAKANGLDPVDYLRYVFATLPNLKTSDEVKQLLPWNVKQSTESELLAA